MKLIKHRKFWKFKDSQALSQFKKLMTDREKKPFGRVVSKVTWDLKDAAFMCGHPLYSGPLGDAFWVAMLLQILTDAYEHRPNKRFDPSNETWVGHFIGLLSLPYLG